MLRLSSVDVMSGLEARLRPFVSRRVRSEADADDVMQEIWLRLHRGLPELRDEERLGPWVFRVARNTITDHRRATARLPLPVDEPPELAAPEPEEDDRAVERELAGVVAAFVGVLPPTYREALTLTELEGRTQKEAAERLGISLSGAKSRVQRGRRLLRDALEECCAIALDARGKVVACEPRTDGLVPTGCCG